MNFNRKTLFDGIRFSLTTHIYQRQVDSINAILDECEKVRLSRKHTAYILATAYHESHFTPIRETFAKSDRSAVRRLNKAYPRKRGTSKCYWCRKPYYFGRGFVQLTWKHNYEKMGRALGIDLQAHPDLALEPDIAAKIIVLGMRKGMFTGKKIGDYKSFYQMRRVVNGTDKARTIARYAETILQSLVEDVDEDEPIQLPLPLPEPIQRAEVETIVVHMSDGQTVTFKSEKEIEEMAAAKKKAVRPVRAVRPDAKPFYSSLTIQGIVLMVISSFVPQLLTSAGFPDIATDVAAGNWHGVLVGAFGILAAYGRTRIKKSILKWPRIILGL